MKSYSFAGDTIYRSPLRQPDGQRHEPVDVDAVLVSQRLGAVQLDVVVPSEKPAKGCGALHPSQRCAEATMYAVPETEMAAGGARDIEMIGIVELISIAVRRMQCD